MQFPNDSAHRKMRVRRGFTLVEMLVVIVIIAVLAGMTLGAVARSREAGRRAKTEATIAKLNNVLVRLYEKYRNKRVPFDYTTLNPDLLAQAKVRRDALRDMMRIELPQCWDDIASPPSALKVTSTAAYPTTQTFSLPYVPGSPPTSAMALQIRYQAILNNAFGLASTPTSYIDVDHEQAKCLYMIVMNAGADARSQFTADEIHMNLRGDPNGDGDNLPCFVDGWSNPIGFLRWAPGYSPWSDIQLSDPSQHHDPFDVRLTQANAYQLYPFIYAGVVGKNNNVTPAVDDYGLVTFGPAGPGVANQPKLSTSYVGTDTNMPKMTNMIDPYCSNITPSTVTFTAATGSTVNPSTLPGTVYSGVPMTNHHMEQK